MTRFGAEDSLPPGEPIEQVLEDFLNLSGRTLGVNVDEDGIMAGYRHGIFLVKAPRMRAAGRVDIRVEE